MENLLSKLQYKDEKSLVYKAPGTLANDLKKAGMIMADTDSGPAGFLLIFFENKADLESRMEGILQKLEYDGKCWVGYPKGSGSINSDLNRDILNHAMTVFGLRGVRLISLDSDWSIMRLRPAEAVKSKK